jgi:hypothetical protein
MRRELARCNPMSRVARKDPGAADGDAATSLAIGIFRATPLSVVVALLFALGAHDVLAVNADEYLFVPTVTQGEREIDLHLGTASSGDTTHAQSNAGLAFGVGVTQHWFTELDVEYRREPAVGTGLDAVEWENILQIAEPGQWPVDVGAMFNVEKSYAASRNSIPREGWSIRLGPLLQKDIGVAQVNINLFVSRFFQSSEFSATQLSYQGQVKWRYSQPLEFGVQAFGRFSSSTQTWTPSPEEVHRVGPVVLGRLVMPRERSLSYNVAFLVGATAHSPDRTLRFQVEYEF